MNSSIMLTEVTQTKVLENERSRRYLLSQEKKGGTDVIEMDFAQLVQLRDFLISYVNEKDNADEESR